MIRLLARIFIKDNAQTSNAAVRQSYGVLCGAVGIGLNILLFAMKLFAGFISGSVAVVADAFNNLSDAGSSAIMMVGFRMSGQKPDPAHPFGHGRIEYVTGLIVSIVIILMGIELTKTSFEKILHPTEIVFAAPTIIILIVSVLIKLYMYSYNKKISEKISSSAMQATALDSFTDSAATSIVLFSMMVAEFTGVHIDGYCGLLVAAFILYTGFVSAKDTLDPLLGTKPDKAYSGKIEQFVLSYPNVLGVHDLIIHDYGPGRMMISLHAEVPASGD
ncbi:MAG TPA: cation diffusion facilitator family transporter, partial [Lachnospiraceae bacterium]|nr:cation diffusion facilitator family transporter [Lachnospiraceae bacterium]